MSLPSPTPPPKKQPRQQLSKGMEHLRYAVTADPIPRPNSSSPSTSTTSPTPPPSSEDNDAYGVPATYAPLRRPTTRSHSPTNNQKRTDPFAFGSRYLEEGDNIFEFNAWDHVEVDPAYKDFTTSQYANQRAAPVSEVDKKRFNDQPEKWWDMFYKNNRGSFFKDRKWLCQEFPVLSEVTREGDRAVKVLEVGAGAGNTAFPILKMNRNQGLRIHACDFSKKAVEVIRGSEGYDGVVLRADVWDVAAEEDAENGGLPPGVEEGSVDVVLMIFIFSALSPRQWDRAVKNIWRILKPGGQVLFRDYGRGDLAQVRFKKGRWMEENFYVRGDGTRVYFFEQEELERIWGGKGSPVSENNESDERGEERIADGIEKLTVDSIEEKQKDEQISQRQDADDQEKPRNVEEFSTPAFEIVHIGVDRRMLVNRQRRLKMYRCWMQAVFRKPGATSDVPISTLRQEKNDDSKEDETVPEAET